MGRPYKFMEFLGFTLQGKPNGRTPNAGGSFLFKEYEQLVDQKRRPGEAFEEGPYTLSICGSVPEVIDPCADQAYSIDSI